MFNNRPDVHRGDGKHADQRDHYDQNQLAVAVDREGAAKLDIDKAVMNESHRAAQNDAKKHAHINDLEAKNKGLPAAVELRVAAAGGQALRQG